MNQFTTAGFFIAAALAVALHTPVASAQTSAAGFNRLLTQLEAARDVILANEPHDGLQQAEGLRHLLRLTEWATEEFEFDARHPGISRCPGGICKIGFDSPDQVQVAIRPLAAPHRYRVHGNLRTVDIVNFQLIDATFTGDQYFTSENMTVGRDGSFEIIVAEENREKAPNFLKLAPQDGSMLLVRVIYSDWANEIEPEINIELIDEDTGISPIPNLDPASFARDGAIAAAKLKAIVDGYSTITYNKVMPDLTSGGLFPAPGRLPLLPGSASGQHTTKSSHAKYDLPADKALIVERHDADVSAGNIQLGNRWLESLDYRTRLVSHNLHQSHRDSDGMYRYVIAHEDPGVPNWLDTSGRERGTIYLRWINAAEPDALLAPRHKVVPLSELRNHLPKDHPTVSKAERNAELEMRAQAINRRFNPAGFVEAKKQQQGASLCNDGGE